MAAGHKVTIVLLCAVQLLMAQDEFLYGTFPEGFEWGAATASYQIEGAWNLNGKGENIWDRQTHSTSSGIANNDTGDVAADSYHLYKTDVAILKQLGVNFYRFSLSWSRLLPNGHTDVINQDGINYYNNLINELIDNGIKPLVTLYHWDLPQSLQDEFGGWLGEEIVDVFGEYAEFAFTQFGDRVKSWMTLNEPWVQAIEGYGIAKHAPRISGSGTNDYIAGHNLIKSHARAWHIYDDKFRATQQGEVGWTLNSAWFEPKSSTNSEDIEAAERALQFSLGWFAHPIFSSDGDYPAVMKEYVAKHSQEEGLSQSRLPEFNSTWVDYIKGSCDFFGLNHYTTNLAEYAAESGETPSYNRDQELITSFDPTWPPSAATWLKVVPWGLRRLLNWIHTNYNGVRVVVAENGFSDVGEIDDIGRVDYYRSYINEMMKAVNLDGCNVSAYTAWSVIDNFEWTAGYTQKFGLYSVDFNDPARPRTQKSSARLYQQIIQDNGFPTPPPTVVSL